MVNAELKKTYAMLSAEVATLDKQIENLTAQRAVKREAVAHLEPLVAEPAEAEADQ